MFFTKEKPITIRDACVHLLAQDVIDYSDWYEEHGIKLPPDFATDPSGWTEALHKMKRAFSLLLDEKNGEGELYDAKHEWWLRSDRVNQLIIPDEEKVKKLEREIAEGLALFGKYLFWMTDDKTR